MKEYKHLGTYGVLIKDNKILLIKKANGPYKGLFDLPGGTIEFAEKVTTTLERELKEEVGIELTSYKLLDVASTNFTWQYDDKTLLNVHHIGIFYEIISFKNNIKNVVEVTQINDDSLGADFYDINSLDKNSLSSLAIVLLEKLGYKLN